VKPAPFVKTNPERVARAGELAGIIESVPADSAAKTTEGTR
jgi:hypothetical protein